MSHVISARRVARDLHTIAPRPLERTCWRQFAVHWGDSKKFRFVPFNAILLLLSWVAERNCNTVTEMCFSTYGLPLSTSPLQPQLLAIGLVAFIFALRRYCTGVVMDWDNDSGIMDEGWGRGWGGGGGVGAISNLSYSHRSDEVLKSLCRGSTSNGAPKNGTHWVLWRMEPTTMSVGRL